MAIKKKHQKNPYGLRRPTEYCRAGKPLLGLAKSELDISSKSLRGRIAVTFGPYSVP
jgi:hypothetical protein